MLDAPQPAGPAAVQGPNRTATILVVDDEPAIRMVLTEILRKQGYAVVACGTGAEAIGSLRKSGPAIDLVLLDMHLPDAQEDSLAAELKRMHDGIRVLASSGFPLNPSVPLEMAHIDGYLKKPFDAKLLAETVDALLLKAPPPATA